MGAGEGVGEAIPFLATLVHEKPGDPRAQHGLTTRSAVHAAGRCLVGRATSMLVIPNQSLNRDAICYQA